MIVIVNLFDSVSATTIPFELSQRINCLDGLRCENLTLSFNPNARLAVNGAMPEALPKASLFGLFRFLRKKVLSESFDIVHTHHPRTAALAALALSPRWRRRHSPGLRHVHTVHNDFRHFKPRTKLAFLLALLVADRVICNSNNTLESLPGFVKRMRGAGRFSVAYNGVDTGLLSKIRAEMGNLEREAFILCAARMVRQKNHLTLLRAFARLRPPAEWRLVLCGEGELRSALEAEAERLGVREGVEFRGALTREETYRLMHRCGIFVMPSLWEGFCNANVEAMAAGAALVVSDAEPIPEVVGDAGRFFSALDEEELARHLQDLIDFSDERVRLGTAGRARAENFSVARAASAYAEIYGSALGEIRSGPSN